MQPQRPRRWVNSPETLLDYLRPQLIVRPLVWSRQTDADQKPGANREAGTRLGKLKARA